MSFEEILRPVARLGRRGRFRLEWGIAGAMIAHVGLAGVTMLPWMGLAAAETEVPEPPALIEMEVDVPPEPEPEPDPEPEPEPEPAAEPEAEPAAEPEPTPEVAPPPPNPNAPPPPPSTEPPAPAAAAPTEAADVMTDDSDGPVDLTGGDWAIVDGQGTGPIAGAQSANGKGKTITRDPRARTDGKEGGTGTGPAPPPKPVGPDRSRPAGIVGGSAWSCPFPSQADEAQVDRATATIVVTVRPNGTPASVAVLSDPGYGFGAAARRCAFGRRYLAAKDRRGNAIQATTPPIAVRFRR